MFRLENGREGTLLEVAIGCERISKEWGMTCTEAAIGEKKSARKKICYKFYKIYRKTSVPGSLLRNF